MSIASHEVRENKLKWLLRPFVWAGNLCVVGLVMTIGPWLDGKIDLMSFAAAPVAVLAIVTGLLVWGVRRVNEASRGRW